MTLLGLDFDNTLVRYDKLFHKLAIEKNLIDKSTPANKVEIRQQLKNKGKEMEFTLMQGEVYGLRILGSGSCRGDARSTKDIKNKKY